MRHISHGKVLENPFFSKNWEADIKQVSVEPCDAQEDPLGYKAVFLIDKTKRQAQASFAVGASFLTKRHDNLSRAGYEAPMTHKAIALIERKLGSHLQMAA